LLKVGIAVVALQATPRSYSQEGGSNLPVYCNLRNSIHVRRTV